MQMNTNHGGSAAVSGHPVVAEPLLRVERLCKIYGGDVAAATAMALSGHTRAEIQTAHNSFAALSDISFDVAEGEVFVIIGLSGSGKSTLLRCVNRLVEPTSGRVMLRNRDILTADPAELRALRLNEISMVFQGFGLLPHKTILDNVSLGLKMRGLGQKARYGIAADLIERVGLAGWEKHYPKDLSGGMRQRVGLARSLAVSPSLLLMDEAFSALDPVIRRDMQAELLRLQSEMKRTIIFITHDIQEALFLGNRIAMVRDGRLVQLGSAADLIMRPADDFVADFTRDADRSRVLHARDIMHHPIEGKLTLPGAAGLVVGFEGGAAKANDGAGSAVEMQYVDQAMALGEVLQVCRADLPIIVQENGKARGAFTRDHLLDMIGSRP